MFNRFPLNLQRVACHKATENALSAKFTSTVCVMSFLAYICCALLPTQRRFEGHHIIRHIGYQQQRQTRAANLLVYCVVRCAHIARTAAHMTFPDRQMTEIGNIFVLYACVCVCAWRKSTHIARTKKERRGEPV